MNYCCIYLNLGSYYPLLHFLALYENDQYQVSDRQIIWKLDILFQWSPGAEYQGKRCDMSAECVIAVMLILKKILNPTIIDLRYNHLVVIQIFWIGAECFKLNHGGAVH